MKAIILHESKGRIRFRISQKKMNFAGSRCAGKLVSKEIMDHTSNCP